MYGLKEGVKNEIEIWEKNMKEWHSWREGGGGGEEIERIKVKQKKYKEAYTSVLPGVKKKQAAGVREYQSTSPEKKSNLLFMATWKQ